MLSVRSVEGGSKKKIMSRDRFDGLKCTVPGCKKVIYAMTGLQEIQKLQAHMRRCHMANWSMGDALHNRVEMEKKD